MTGQDPYADPEEETKPVVQENSRKGNSKKENEIRPQFLTAALSEMRR